MNIPNVMSNGDRELIKAIQDVYKNIKSITRGGCKYCMPCPQGIHIPELFRLYNHFMYFNKPMGTTLFYKKEYGCTRYWGRYVHKLR
jgi:predicted aldo/keto reductase-like oxidoreductase